MFSGRGDIQKAFVGAMKDLEKAIGKLSDAQQEKVFGRAAGARRHFLPARSGRGQSCVGFRGIAEATGRRRIGAKGGFGAAMSKMA